MPLIGVGTQVWTGWDWCALTALTLGNMLVTSGVMSVTPGVTLNTTEIAIIICDDQFGASKIQKKAGPPAQSRHIGSSSKGGRADQCHQAVAPTNKQCAHICSFQETAYTVMIRNAENDK